MAVSKSCRAIVVGVMGLLLCAGLPVRASAEVSLDELLQRVEKLEKENATLKAEVMEMKAKQVAPPQPVAQVATIPSNSTSIPPQNFLKTKLDTELYGFISLVGAYSTADASTDQNTNGSTAAYNAPHETVRGKHQDSFNMSAQDTRLGLNFKGPELNDGGKVSGKFEMDFAANNGPTYQPRLRHAYTQLDYEKWGVTAGHTWDFFSPINSNLLNVTNLWRAGNLGIRHPEAYLTNRWGNVLGGKVSTKIGVIDSDDPLQENSAMPVYGAYASYDTKIFGAPATFGIGGIYGKDSTDVLNAKGSKNNNIYGTAIGMTLKFTDWLCFKTEGYSGAKLNSFMAGPASTSANLGISNTATLSDSKSIRDMGGFMELTYNPIKKVETNVGTGIDDINNNADIQTNRNLIWSTNRTFYANVKYNLTKEFLIGLEYQYFHTNYLDGLRSDSNRFETAVIYKF